MSFWRDREGLEIDFMIEQPDGIIAIEAKSGQTFTDSLLDSLRKVQRIAHGAVRHPSKPSARHGRSFSRDRHAGSVSSESRDTL